MLTESNANIVKGPYMTRKCYEMLHPELGDERTGDEIKKDILKKLKGGAE